VTTVVSQAVASTLKLGPGEIDPDRPLSLYGLDSLSSAELVAALEDAVGHTLPDWFLTDHRTVNDVVAALGGAAPKPPLDLMGADAELPADIRPAAPHPHPHLGLHHEAPAAPHVLLTGATGFLGAWLLRELAETSGALTCLVRGHDGRDRVRRNLTRYGLWREAYWSRVRVVCGDIRQPHLGLEPREYHALANQVDVIHHAAADVNWTLPYDGLREPNVIGKVALSRLSLVCRNLGGSERFLRHGR
jgi:acyl carrier protein